MGMYCDLFMTDVQLGVSPQEVFQSGAADSSWT